MPSSTSPTPSARSNSRTTGPCTTGFSSISRFRLDRGSNEFARLNLTQVPSGAHELVRGGHATAGTIRALRRWQGFRRPPASRRNSGCAISSSGGVAKANSVVDIANVRFCRSARSSPDGLAPDGRFLRPLKIVIEKLSGGPFEEIEAVKPSRQPLGGGHAACVSAASSMSSVTISWENPEEVLSALARTRFGCATPFRYLSGGGEKPGRRSG